MENTKKPRYYCDECQDTGIVEFQVQRISPVDGSIRVVTGTRSCKECKNYE